MKPLTAKQIKAATMVAQREMTHVQIAAALSINAATLTNWKNLTLFRQEVASLLDAATRATKDEAIRSIDERISEQSDRWEGLRRTRRKRVQIAVETGDADAFPGADTGLFNPAYRYDKEGNVVSRAWTFDRHFAGEMRALEDSVGESLGQKVSKTEISGPGGGPIEVRTTIGYHTGIVADTLRQAEEIKKAGRWPSDPSGFPEILREIEERHLAGLKGQEVPGWEVRFRAARDDEDSSAPMDVLDAREGES